eukprot:Rmarinus@m.7138
MELKYSVLAQIPATFAVASSEVSVTTDGGDKTSAPVQETVGTVTGGASGEFGDHLFALQCGSRVLYMSAPAESIRDSWVADLQEALRQEHEKFKIFPKKDVHVEYLDGRRSRVSLENEKIQTIQDLREAVSEEVGLPYFEPFAIIETYSRGGVVFHESILAPDMRLKDLMAQWERNARVHFGGPPNTIPGGKMQLLLRRVQYDSMVEVVHPTERYLDYIQAVADVRARDMFGPEVILKLAALQACAELGPWTPQTRIPTAERYLPRGWLNGLGVRLVRLRTLRGWVKEIDRYHMELGNIDRNEAMRRYIEKVKLWPFYGSTFFRCRQVDSSRGQSMSCILAVSEAGIQVLSRKSLEMIHRYDFFDIGRWMFNEDAILISILPDEHHAQGYKLTFETSQGREIAELVRLYVNRLVRRLRSVTSHQT